MAEAPGQAMGLTVARVLHGIACPLVSQVVRQRRSGGRARATVYQQFLRTR